VYTRPGLVLLAWAMRVPISCAMLGACEGPDDFRADEERLAAVGAELRRVAALERGVGMAEYAPLTLIKQSPYFNTVSPALSEIPGALRLNGFTLLFEALIPMLAQQMPFRAVGRIVGESEYKVLAVCRRYVHIAGGLADYSGVTSLGIDETSRARGHLYVTIAADADQRRVVFVGDGRGANAVAELAEHLDAHGCPPQQISRVSIDMSAAYIKGVGQHLPQAQITFDKFHVIAHANAAVDKTRRVEQRTDPEQGAQLKGMRWTLLKDVGSLKPQAGAALHALISAPRLTMTARAWAYKERLRLAMEHKQVNVLRGLLQHWCTCVMRSKIDAMKDVAAMIRSHMEGIVAWAQTRQTNGFLEAINGLFQAAKRRARGYGTFDTIKTVIFPIAGKPDFRAINPHAGQPT
jgi:transposase